MISKSVKYFSSDIITSFELAIKDCLQQIQDYLHNDNLNTNNIFLISIFIRADNNDDFKSKKSAFKKIAKERFEIIPPLSFVAQAPFQINISCELIVGQGEFNIIDKDFDKIRYRIVEFQNHSEIYTSEINSELDNVSIKTNSELTFQKMKKLLKYENLEFSNIIRQWNYIENILDFEKSKNYNLQNYQALNNIRAEFYSKSNWINGYPAATGIGMNSGKITTNFIAIKNIGNTIIFPIHSNVQSDAHKYSERVLISDKNENNTPKFERGKIVFYNINIDFYISGTAAIVGENTIKALDIEEQTKVTLKNIKNLVSKKNLENNIPPDFSSRIKNNVKLNEFSNFRVYVKNETDIPKAKQICEQYISSTPAIYLVADICRENLLVEIEGNFFTDIR